MVIRTTLTQHDDGDVYTEVFTDNGGDQSYGPFRSVEQAMSILRSVVENDFDQTFDPDKHSVVPHVEPDCDDTTQ